MINAAIVGLGGMGNLHREMINEGSRMGKKVPDIPQWKVTGCFDVLKERREYGRSCGLCSYDSLEELLKDPKISMIICATPNDCHKDIVIRSLKAGKNVICEKPVALSVEDLDEMIKTAQKTGMFFTVGQNRRWDKDYAAAKAIYEQQLIGKIYRIESRVHGSRGIPQDWRKKRECGGGMVYDWGVHLIDQAVEMIPEKLKYVYADLNYFTEKDVDDGFHAELIFESGLVYFIEVGTSNFISLPRWYMIGSEGNGIIKDWDLQGEICRVIDRSQDVSAPVQAGSGITKTMAPRVRSTVETLPLPHVSMDISQFYNQIADVLQYGTQERIKLDQVRKTLQIIEAVFESAKTHQVIPFK